MMSDIEQSSRDLIMEATQQLALKHANELAMLVIQRDAEITRLRAERDMFMLSARNNAQFYDQACAERDMLREALKPFAQQIEAIECTTSHPICDGDTWPVDSDQVVKVGDLRRARAALSAAPAERANGWRPIESAPKDETWILAYSPSASSQAIQWSDNQFGEKCWRTVNYWWSEAERYFTHWMPIPPPPAAPEKGGE